MKHKVAIWIAGVVLGLIVLVGITAAVVLRSTWFHSYVLNIAQKKAGEAIGTSRCSRWRTPRLACASFLSCIRSGISKAWSSTVRW